MLEERHHDGRTSRFAFDGDGLLLRAENEGAKVAFKRDAAGRVIKETQGGHDIVRTFDPAGKHVHTESSLGASVDYGHDGQGRLRQMSSGEWTAKWLRDRVGLEAERHLTGGVHITIRRDKFGRETFKGVGARNVEQLRRRYTWDMGNRLLVARDEISGRVAQYDYDEFDNLIAAEYERGGAVERLYRVPDRMGNLYDSPDRTDRTYARGGQLREDRRWRYHYDEQGNLVLKTRRKIPPVAETTQGNRKGIFGLFANGNTSKERGEQEEHLAWHPGDYAYTWLPNGMLGSVTRPDGKTITFKYDALGRRMEKTFNGRVHRYLWDGDVILHEWEYNEAERPQPIVAENGEMSFDEPEPTDNLVTWVYDPDSYVPTAKLVNGKRYGIVSDYIGRPVQAYDERGTVVWQADYDIYGNLLNLKGDRGFVPFRQLGQYEDGETGLYYNRFRYYDPSTGGYVSQDPIGLAGNNPTLYGYVFDSNAQIDPFGLECWKTAKEKFWKAEAEAHPHKYSPDNLSRMAEGKPPRMTVEVFNRKTGMLEIRDVSMELHHTYLPKEMVARQ